MGFSIDGALGIHDDALSIRARRARVLAANLANADTPHFKARDLDFREALRQAAPDSDPSNRVRLIRTHAAHRSDAEGPVFPGDVSYRVPTQPALDGNTVDADVERSEFTRNSMSYLASLRFLSGRVKSLLSAIRGE